MARLLKLGVLEDIGRLLDVINASAYITINDKDYLCEESYAGVSTDAELIKACLEVEGDDRFTEVKFDKDITYYHHNGEVRIFGKRASSLLTLISNYMVEGKRQYVVDRIPQLANLTEFPMYDLYDHFIVRVMEYLYMKSENFEDLHKVTYDKCMNALMEETAFIIKDIRNKFLETKRINFKIIANKDGTEKIEVTYDYGKPRGFVTDERYVTIYDTNELFIAGSLGPNTDVFMHGYKNKGASNIRVNLNMLDIHAAVMQGYDVNKINTLVKLYTNDQDMLDRIVKHIEHTIYKLCIYNKRHMETPEVKVEKKEHTKEDTIFEKFEKLALNVLSDIDNKMSVSFWKVKNERYIMADATILSPDADADFAKMLCLPRPVINKIDRMNDLGIMYFETDWDIVIVGSTVGKLFENISKFIHGENIGDLEIDEVMSDIDMSIKQEVYTVLLEEIVKGVTKGDIKVSPCYYLEFEIAYNNLRDNHLLFSTTKEEHHEFQYIQAPVLVSPPKRGFGKLSVKKDTPICINGEVYDFNIKESHMCRLASKSGSINIIHNKDILEKIMNFIESALKINMENVLQEITIQYMSGATLKVNNPFFVKDEFTRELIIGKILNYTTEGGFQERIAVGGHKLLG